MPSEPRARSGCCAKSCLLLVILGVLFVGVVVGGGYWVMNKGIAALTSDKPVAIKIEQPTDAQFDAAATKFNDLSNALTIGEARTIEFTASDLNALIARHPGYFFPRLKGKIHFNISDGLLGADMSVPLTGVMPASAPQWARDWIDGRISGRYFNGRVRTFFELVSGEATLEPKSAEVNGEVIREVDFKKATDRGEWNKFVNETLLKNVMLGGKDPKDVFSGVASARINADRLVVITKARAPR